MSCIYKGEVVDTDLSSNARGGTEMMRERLLQHVPADLLQNFAIHFSRPREIYSDVKNIFFAHDLATDPENAILQGDGWKQFEKFVFVSYWQRDQYIMMHGIPYSKCAVIENAIEMEYSVTQKSTDVVRFIYHTTPHRGLELLYPIFDALSKEFSNIHLEVFSSFEIYGWKERDKAYLDLFSKLSNHPNITYYGTQSNDTVLAALKNSHIFLYPCIWQETSCIAMIEAIRAGCLVIHPTLAALPETASTATIMYDYHEDPSVHANIAYRAARTVLNIQKNDPAFINNFTNNVAAELPRNSIQGFKSKWINLLEQVK